MDDQTAKLGLEYLEARGVSRATFERYGGEITGIDRDRIAKELGWNANTFKSQKIGWAAATLHFPIFGLNGLGRPESWIIRLLSLDGSRPNKEPKFRIPTRGRSPAWIPPTTREAAKDASLPMILTEGIVKGMALAQAGALPIAFQGVWNVAEPKAKRAQKELKSTAENPDGEIDAETEIEAEEQESTATGFKLRKELSGFEWTRRKLYLGFDADWRTNSKVRQATIRTALSFAVQGAEVYQLTHWPLSEGKGVDDYLTSKCGVDPERQKQALDGLIESAKPFFETLETADLSLAMKELIRVEMDEAHFLQLTGMMAKPLGVPVSALRAVRQRDEEGQEGQGKKLIFPPLEPWSEPVDGKQLLAELCALIHTHIFLTEAQALTIALWILWSYFVHEPSVEVSPYLGITGPDKRCAKTRLLNLVTRLVPRGLCISSISQSAFFRMVEKYHPTLLLDELHRLLVNRPELLQILLNAFDRDKPVLLTNPDTLEVEAFDIWGARAVAYLGNLDDQLRDRIIEIHLERKPAREKRTKLRETAASVTDTLRRKCLRWYEDNREAVLGIEKMVLDVTNDRAGDSWEFLLAIAGVINPECARQAYACALKLEKEERNDDAIGPLVLEGLKKIFQVKCQELKRPFKSADLFLPVTQLCAELNGDELAPWSEWKTRSGDLGITPHKLVRILRGYQNSRGEQIKPIRKMPDASLTYPSASLQQRTNVNGYELRELRPVFECYIPSSKEHTDRSNPVK
jgi:hypothetical protein